MQIFVKSLEKNGEENDFVVEAQSSWFVLQMPIINNNNL